MQKWEPNVEIEPLVTVCPLQADKLRSIRARNGRFSPCPLVRKMSLRLYFESAGMTIKSLDDFDLSGKRVLIRVDLNVPLKDGKIADATRILRILPTIREVLAKGGLPILLSHFGRPKGQVEPSMSLRRIGDTLREMIGASVTFSENTIGIEAASLIRSSAAGSVVVLENTRFYRGEEKNDPAFAAELASLGDIFVNDAFSAAHRAHASTEGIAKILPSAVGRAMEMELNALDAALGSPQKPVVAIVGGAKISTKLDLLANLVSKVDHLVIGGGMANTFLASRGIDIGRSLCEFDRLDTARAITKKAQEASCAIMLPIDIICAKEFQENAPCAAFDVNDCPEDRMILDAGPKSVAAICKEFETAKTLVWNGPLGAFEITPFDAATNAAAIKAAELTRKGQLVSIAGGGDTVAALNQSGAAPDFTYISTAGGAFLAWMEGKVLPGVAALDQ
jgi:phosphoglycerate kinase